MCHNLAARRSARSLTRLYDQHLAPSGLSVSQYSILAVIVERDGITVAELSRMMVMERTTLMRALGPLEKAGLIERRQEPGERAMTFHLSATGRAKVEQAAPLWQQAQQSFERRAGAERAAKLREIILEIGFSD